MEGSLPATATFQHGSVPVGEGIQLHYAEYGDPNGTPVVLLHGWPQHWISWRRVMPVLAEHGYRPIAVDLRGSGGSSITPSGYDKKSLAGDIRALAKHLGLERMALVGNDHGAGVAYAYAAQWPEEVSHLAVMEYWLGGYGYEKFLAATPDWHNGSNWQLVLFTLPDVAEWLLRGRERELLSWFFWHAAFKNPAVSSDDFEEYVRQYTRPGGLRAGINYYAAIWQDIEDNKVLSRRKLTMRVAGVGGVASGGEHVAAALAPVVDGDVTAIVIPEAGHWALDENPEAVAAALGEFLTA
jgi:pimeloyl-ACP methyl ester carboxylesterase